MRSNQYADLVQKRTKYVNTPLQVVAAPTSRPLMGPLVMLSLRHPHSRQCPQRLMIIRQVMLSKILFPMSLYKQLICPGLAPSRMLTTTHQRY